MMSLTTVSFAAEEVSYFDEETGTLYLMNENWYEDLGIVETEEALFDFCEKVKIVYFGEECDTVGYCFYFYNLEEVVVDDAHANLYVYDKALYTKADNVMIYYPLASDDTDIVLSPDATYIGDSCFVDYFEQTYVNKIYGFYYHPIDKEYSLYINSVEQLQTIMNNNQRSDGTLDRLYYAKFNNIYVNGEKSKIDAVTQEVHPFDQDTWFTSATYTAFWAYMTLDYFGDINANDYFKMIDAETIMKDYLEDENFDIDEDTTEFYRVYFERVVEIWRNCEHNEVTRERFNSVLATAGDETKSVFIEHFGDLDTAYDVTHKVLESMYNHFLYLYNRGNPIKPLSTLTSGTCGEGAEWAIDRENGVLSITGNGAISDNYSGFDVFKDIVTTVEIGNGITAIGENVFTGFTALTETKFDGTQAQWDAVTVADGNEDLTKNVTVIPETPDTPDVPDTPVTPDTPDEPAEPTFGEKVVAFFEKVGNFFVSIYEWFINLFKF